jgi:Arc/MetJ-type ribon-helix-helix transcriptional regulator
MAKSINVLRKRGRPATGQDPVSAIRLSTELTRAIDQWAVRNKAESRSEAIRRLVEMALGKQPKPGAGLKRGQYSKPRERPKAKSEASDLAGEQIDKLADSSATAEERQMRKRRLLKGPKEFRDIRLDLPKPKVTAKRKGAK